MDILGAIAIGTEPYNKENSSSISKRVSRKEQMIRIDVLRNIIVQGVYQITVLLVLMYLGDVIFFEKPIDLVQEPLRDSDGLGTNKLTLNTICFHTFFLMNWFNTLNCRIVDPEEINVFKSICNN